MNLTEMKVKERELQDKASKLSTEILQHQLGDNSPEAEEYSKILRDKAELSSQITIMSIEEATHGHKPQLPEVPNTYLDNEHYFNKKAELEERESRFKKAYDDAEQALERISTQYDSIVLNGTDDEINTAYDELQETVKRKEIAQGKLEALKKNSDDHILDIAAIEIYQSRVHLNDIYEAKHEKLVKQYQKIKDELQQVEGEIEQYNAEYLSKMNAYKKVLRVQEKHNEDLLSKFRHRPTIIQATKLIKLTDK